MSKMVFEHKINMKSSEYNSSLTNNRKPNDIQESTQNKSNSRNKICQFFSCIFCCRSVRVRRDAKVISTVAPSFAKKTLVLDLDETLVHSTPKRIDNPDLQLEVTIEGVECHYFVSIRPHLEKFLRVAEQLFAVVIYTASLEQYASLIIDHIDSRGTLKHRLYRDSCVIHNGVYVKDLGSLCRDLKDVCIIDNSPMAYALHPQNAIPIQSWFGCPDDNELLKLLPLLDALSNADDIPEELAKINK